MSLELNLNRGSAMDLYSVFSRNYTLQKSDYKGWSEEKFEPFASTPKSKKLKKFWPRFEPRNSQLCARRRGQVTRPVERLA
jgi:hypothetical protein